jgi:hypothetical protein
MGVKGIVKKADLLCISNVKTSPLALGDLVGVKFLNDGEFFSRWAGYVLKRLGSNYNRGYLLYNRKGGVKLRIFLCSPGLFKLLRFSTKR